MRGGGGVVEDGEAMRGGRRRGVVVEEEDEGGGKIHIKKGEKLNNDVLADVDMKIWYIGILQRHQCSMLTVNSIYGPNSKT